MRKVLPLAVTGLLALSACQFSGGDDAADETRHLNTMEAFPIHTYMPDPSTDGEKSIGTAQWILAKKCMIGLGFSGFTTLNIKTVDSTYPVRQGSFIGLSTLDDDRPYGVDDPDQAAEHGYHTPKKEDDSARPLEWSADQYSALTGTFDAGASHRVNGHTIPENGCLGRATQTLYGAGATKTKVAGVKVAGYYTLPYQLWSEARQEAAKDKAWKKAERDWSACMKKKGFHYSDPNDATVDRKWLSAENPSGKEKKTAAADARCKLDTDYIDTAHRLESRAQKKLISAHEKDLKTAVEQRKQAARNARKVIAKES